MGHFLIVNCHRQPGKGFQEYRLADELRQRGYGVTIAIGSTKFSEYGYDPSAPEWKKKKAVFFHHRLAFAALALLHPVVVFANDKHTLALHDICKKLKRKVLKHSPFAHFDIYGNGADLYCLAGSYYKDIFHFHEGDRKYDVTGSLVMDLAYESGQTASKKDFCQKYGLDPEKPIGVLCTKAPQAQTAAEIEVYKGIVETLQRRGNWQLLLKGHPNDHVGAKSWQFDGKKSWEVNFPDVRVLDPEDGFIGMQFATLGLGTTTSVSLEFALYRVPFLHVDRFKCMLPDGAVLPEGFEVPKPKPWGLHHYDVPEYYRKQTLELGKARNGKFRLDYCSVPPFAFAGAECDLPNLDEYLDFVQTHPAEIQALPYDQVTEEAFCRFDGKSHVRVADSAERLLHRSSVQNSFKPSSI